MKKALLALLFLIMGLNGSAQWTSHQIPGSSIDFAQEIYFVTPSIGFITGQESVPSSHLNGYIYKTTNGGTSWTLVKSLIGTSSSLPYKSFSLDAMHFVNANVGFCVGENFAYNFICKTIDGGNTWDTLSYSNSSMTGGFTDVHFTDINTGFCSASDGRIYKSTDGGSTWTQVHTISGNPAINDITFINSTTGFAVTAQISNQSYILKTTNGGVNWNVVHTSGNQNISSISMGSSTTGYAVSTSAIQYKTTDGGNTWVETTIPSMNGCWEMHFVSPTTGYLSGLSGFSRVLKKTTNGGTTWITDYTDFEINTFYNYSFVGNTAYAISLIDYIKTSSAPLAIEESLTNYEISLYPNPSSDIIRLDFPVDAEISDVKIYDPTSKLVINETNEFSQINIQNLAKGIYLLNVENNNQIIYSTKFIKE